MLNWKRRAVNGTPMNQEKKLRIEKDAEGFYWLRIQAGGVEAAIILRQDILMDDRSIADRAIRAAAGEVGPVMAEYLGSDPT